MHTCKKNKVSAAKFEFLYFLYERCLRRYLFKLKKEKKVPFKKGLNHTTQILLLLISPGFKHLRSGFGRRGLYPRGLIPQGAYNRDRKSASRQVIGELIKIRFVLQNVIIIELRRVGGGGGGERVKHWS